jgi:EAL domain-containing protein (putative c-di-GMP-specific phosphodiesterase class I)
LNATLRQCSRWRDTGLDLAVAVNLSMRNLHNPDLPDTIAGLLGAYGVVPESLVLEITESTLMADAKRALAIVGALRHLGVRLSIDDFGTGYSSLVHLKQLPVDELKIDQGFVRHLATSSDDAAIVRSTIALAHDLGLTVVAEGVEDRRACELLAGYGCDIAQGYYISRPVPAGQIPSLLQSLAATVRNSALAA